MINSTASLGILIKSEQGAPPKKQFSIGVLLTLIAVFVFNLFIQFGFDRIGVNDIMADAGLTQGAFYAHFATKSDLYSEAIISGARLRTEQQNTKSASLHKTVRINDCRCGYISSFR